MAGISKAERERRAAEAAAAGLPPGPDTEDNATENELAAVALVAMVRGDEYPEPHAADVHPDEVANYSQGGWQIAS